MRFLFYSYLIGVMLLTNHADAKCQKPEQGPPGPPGPSGSLVTNYVSSSSSPQIFLDIGTHPIEFQNNIIPPVGIIHPYQSTDSDFQILNTGVYQISWTVQVNWDPRTKNIIELYLYDVTASSQIPPIPVGKATFDDHTASAQHPRYMTLSGQTIISLSANTVIQLQINLSNASTAIVGGIFTITNIAM
jgi:hypothetical protein